MKKQMWAGVVAAICGLSIGTAAQTAGSQPPSGSRSASDQITVTGCLQRDTASGTAGATGTSGAAGTSAAATKFVLNVSPSPSSSPSTAGTAGSSATPTASSYKLDADDAKLTPHVGHKVEITGTVDKSSSASATATSPAGSATATAGAPKLKVDSVRMIAASCSS